mmetsp:Transcript_4034/g.9813  ORF Transcript_4034/g.9813 Transcript_4034/m.9813 type:complete len:224 (+) Transcript_4034:3570-4241(+)
MPVTAVIVASIWGAHDCRCGGDIVGHTVRMRVPITAVFAAVAVIAVHVPAVVGGRLQSRRNFRGRHFAPERVEVQARGDTHIPFRSEVVEACERILVKVAALHTVHRHSPGKCDSQHRVFFQPLLWRRHTCGKVDVAQGIGSICVCRSGEHHARQARHHQRKLEAMIDAASHEGCHGVTRGSLDGVIGFPRGSRARLPAEESRRPATGATAVRRHQGSSAKLI